jgi:hypothetical protein
MAIGLQNEDGTPLFKEDEEPWASSHVKVMEWKPTADHLHSEVLRRYYAYDFVQEIKRRLLNKAWARTKCINWLNEHPISWEDNGITDAAIDVLYVSEELSRRKALMMEGINAIEEQNAALEGRWSGSQPMLRLIHCLIDDDSIKSAFLH